MAPADKEFEELVEKHSRVMSGAIRRVCGRRHQSLIPDVEQEVRLALWKRLQGGKKIEHPVSYVYKAALTTALAVLQRHAPEDQPWDEEMQASQARQAPRPHGLEPAERARLLEQVLGQLPDEQSRALKAYLAGFNHAEVAAMYGWSESVARHRIYRGMEALKSKGKGTVENA